MSFSNPHAELFSISRNGFSYNRKKITYYLFRAKKFSINWYSIEKDVERSNIKSEDVTKYCNKYKPA